MVKSEQSKEKKGMPCIIGKKSFSQVRGLKKKVSLHP